MATGGSRRTPGTASEFVSVALVNDFAHVVADLEQRLRAHGPSVRVVDAEAGASEVGSADVVVFDCFGTRRSALRRVRALRAGGRRAPVIVSVLEASPLFLDGLARLGVAAVVPATSGGAGLVQAVVDAAAGRRPASFGLPDPGGADRSGVDEEEVVALALAGFRTADIADELMCSEESVDEALAIAVTSLAVHDLAALTRDRRIRHLMPSIPPTRWRDFRREPGQVAAARRFVEDRLRVGGADADTSAVFRLAASELGANAVEHGAGVTWTVGAYGSRDWWSLEVCCGDAGGATLLHRPSEWAIAAAREPSGRGLGIVRSVMDDVTTIRSDGQLRVVCRRRRDRGEAGAAADGPR